MLSPVRPLCFLPFIPPRFPPFSGILTRFPLFGRVTPPRWGQLHWSHTRKETMMNPQIDYQAHRAQIQREQWQANHNSHTQDYNARRNSSRSARAIATSVVALISAMLALLLNR